MLAKTYAGSRLSNRGDDKVVMVQTVNPGGEKPYVVGFLKHEELHSPTGFEWGYGGSGPADLALSILTDYFEGERELAEVYYHEFKFDVVAKFPKLGWTLPSPTIDNWVKEKTGLTGEQLLGKYRAIGSLNEDVARQFLGDLRCKK